MTDAIRQLLRGWLKRKLNEPQYAWFEGELRNLSKGQRHALEILFGITPRRLDRADLKLSSDELTAAATARPGWDPRGWTVDEAARILALLEFAEADADGFAEAFKELCRIAELGELVALYRGLPLYPRPEKLEWQAGEGLRTSMRAIFEAIAHRNPYPMENFLEERWNHMVLKALFIGSSLAQIQGLDERRNLTLARMLADYAHERWAAGRQVAPELWRCLGPFAEGEMVDDLARLSRSDDENERLAAALALSASPDRRASKVLERIPVEARMVKSGSLSWERLSADSARLRRL